MSFTKYFGYPSRFFSMMSRGAVGLFSRRLLAPPSPASRAEPAAAAVAGAQCRRSIIPRSAAAAGVHCSAAASTGLDDLATFHAEYRSPSFPEGVPAAAAAAATARLYSSSSCSAFQSSSSALVDNGDDVSLPDGKSHHKVFEEQMRELESERELYFGSNEGGDAANAADGPPLDMYSSPSSPTPADNSADSSDRGGTSDTTGTTTASPTSDERLERMYETREYMYGFTSKDYAGWSNNGPNHSHGEEFMEAVRLARSTQDRQDQQGDDVEGADVAADGATDIADDATDISTSQYEQQRQQEENEAAEGGVFTHLTPTGEAVSMVDVGAKAVTARVAVARTRVVFPPEVMKAFGSSAKGDAAQERELIGPKGPILATAKIAGIMGAKRTSELIPLCHPLPLDRVHIDVTLVDNAAIIECECRVTHKTGVEMEALTGATVTALTIYDMCKAVSHNIKIADTVLVSKSGGKRLVDNQDLVIR